ncbi:hypothetical protein BP00DRAFT_426648 [Aspergillus indologenus CBS 114.80]|uniref:Uncharacterized protein n=1 Tax=Aspergillus indologenus CBS 114.80 TaxID=1450541 RepID=A0A2V5I0S1_9EURO|nr:hypothetical protein BP00DRAFT_426648 [Aspergillus indologenus CBS 114.80]
MPCPPPLSLSPFAFSLMLCSAHQSFYIRLAHGTLLWGIRFDLSLVRLFCYCYFFFISIPISLIGFDTCTTTTY